MGKLVKIITELDLFGHSVGIMFKGDPTYKTLLGAVTTIGLYVIMIANFVLLITAYHDGSRQEQKNGYRKIDRHFSEAYYLDENNFELSFFTTFPIPPELGRMKAFQVDYTCGGECLDEIDWT